MRAALVLGGASCVWDDVEAALELGEFAGVVACNDAAAVWPGHVDAFVTHHPEKAGLWLKRRERAGLAPPAAIYGHVQPRRNRALPILTHATVAYFPSQTLTGSSGLFAAKVALVDLAFDRAVLCGVPMEAKAGHFVRGVQWNPARSYHPGWKQALPHLMGRLKSMSGWTRDQLGEPTPEWLSAQAG